jgi:hypothetical protein
LSNFDGDNFDRLNRVDQVLVTMWGLEAEVNNGGFDQYYFNGAGNQAFFAPEALRAIGAHPMASIVVPSLGRRDCSVRRILEDRARRIHDAGREHI